MEEIDNTGKARKVILDNVYKTLICNTCYLGYDFYEIPKCDDWLFLYRKCHSRFCSSCGIKLQKALAIKTEVMCINANIDTWYLLFLKNTESSLEKIEKL